MGSKLNHVKVGIDLQFEEKYNIKHFTRVRYYIYRNKMRCKNIFLVIFILFISAQTYDIIAQYTPEEIAARPEWEDFLKTAKITDWKDMGSGVTKPLRLELKKGEVENKGVWKNPMGIRGGLSRGMAV